MKKRGHNKLEKLIVSLVVPVFNEEKYLPKMLESLCKQSKMPDEIVICDNNSTDKSAEIIKSYSKKLPIKYLFEKKKGILPCVNTAFENSKGSIVIRTDADCILPKNWVKNICKHFEDDNLDALGGEWYFYDASGLMKVIDRIVMFVTNIFGVFINNKKFLFGANCAFRRSVLEKIGAYKWEGVDDQEMYKKLLEGGYVFRRFRDCVNFTSCRRFDKNFWEVVKGPLSLIDNRLYEEKSV